MLLSTTCNRFTKVLFAGSEVREIVSHHERLLYRILGNNVGGVLPRSWGAAGSVLVVVA